MMLCVCSDAAPLRTTAICLVHHDVVVPLEAEVAITEAERSRGLRGRNHLPADEAMLFVYKEPRPADNAFWMYQTGIPLTLAFFDSQGEIVSTHQMPPCTDADPTECPRYEAGHTHRGAIEVSRGLLDKHQLGEGAHVRLGTGPKESPCAATQQLPFP